MKKSYQLATTKVIQTFDRTAINVNDRFSVFQKGDKIYSLMR